MKTRDRILTSALELSRQIGFEGLTIGALAKSVGMSKSGLFGHFNSKEKLQKMVLDYAASEFTREVIRPALKTTRGLERLDKMISNWLNWSTTNKTGGCPFISAIIEFDDRPGEVREHVKYYQNLMLESFAKAVSLAIEEDELASDCNPKQFAFQLYGYVISYHVYHRLLEEEKAQEMFLDAYVNLKFSYSKEEK